jgi:hypothetical protein
MFNCGTVVRIQRINKLSGAPYFQFLDSELNYMKSNFISVICMWVKSIIGTVHVQGKNANTLHMCRTVRKTLMHRTAGLHVKLSLKLSDLKEILKR